MGSIFYWFERVFQKFLDYLLKDINWTNLSNSDSDDIPKFGELFNQEDILPYTHDIFHAYLSKLLYEDATTIKNQGEEWGFEKNLITVLNYSPSGNSETQLGPTQAAVFKHDGKKMIVVAFRGIEPTAKNQWKIFLETDFTAGNDSSEKERIEVHTGFCEALGLNQVTSWNRIDLEDVSDKSPIVIQLLDYLNQLKKNDNDKFQISVTGHGLGGALASLFSYVLLLNGYQSFISGLYTYGQPLTGNKAYAKFLNDKLGDGYRRWVNHNDIVSLFPPLHLPKPTSDEKKPRNNETSDSPDSRSSGERNLDYYHAGLLFEIDEKGNLLQQTVPSVVKSAFHSDWNPFRAKYSTDGLWVSITKSIHFQWFKDMVQNHSPYDYTTKITNIRNNKNEQFSSN